jgi:hypothetical protein
MLIKCRLVKKKLGWQQIGKGFKRGVNMEMKT